MTLENRIIYYLSRLISSQKEVEFFGDDYDSIKKVYSIWICTDSKINDDSINELHFTQSNIYGKERTLTHLDKMHGIIINLRSNPNAKESKHKLISMLEDLISSRDATAKKKLLETKHNIKMTTTLEWRLSNMCNLSDLIVDRAIQKSLAQGMEIGISAFIKSLQKLGQDNDYILNELMENFSLSKEDALKYF